MFLQILLLIVWLYLSIAFTLFFVSLRVVDKKTDKMKHAMNQRDKKLDTIIDLLHKILKWI